MQPVNLQAGANPASGETAKAGKMMQAAQQFEAVLLNTMLSSLQESFTIPGGGGEGTGADNYRYLATQALATFVAAGRGIGIAGMIVRNLLAHEGSGPVRPGGPSTKV